MKFKTLTREEFEKMSPEGQKIIRQQMEAAQKQQAIIDKRDETLTVMTWELFKKNIVLDNWANGEQYLDDLFEDCHFIAGTFIGYVDRKKRGDKLVDKEEDAEPAI